MTMGRMCRSVTAYVRQRLWSVAVGAGTITMQLVCSLRE